MEQYALYLVLKDLITKLGYDFKISFNDYDINGDNVIGIMFKSGANPEYRELSTGKYYGYANRVQILVQSSYSKISLVDTLNLIQEIREVLTSGISNNSYKVDALKYTNGKIVSKTEDVDYGQDVLVGITSTHLIGDVDFKSKSSQNRSLYSLNLLFKYYITWR